MLFRSIDVRVYELEQIPDLDKKRKHSIEVVVDRLIVQPNSKQRLAESFETALAIADDVALVEVLSSKGSEPGEELLFSARYACPHCGYSLNELEPRVFSFNNPAGACPDCDGLGARQFFDPDRVIQDGTVSLAAGSISGWGTRNLFVFNRLHCRPRASVFDF